MAGGVAAFVVDGLDGDMLRLAAFLVGAALLALLVALAGWWAAGPWVAQGLLALLYLTVASLRSPDIDTSAPAVAAALLVSGELAVLSRSLFDGLLLDPRELTLRLLVLAGLGVGSVAVGWVLLGAAVASVPGGMLTTAMGGVAAVAALGVVLAVARASRR